MSALFLTTTSDKLQVVTASAVAVDVHASYADVTTAGAVTIGRLNSKITTATTTDVVGSPLGATSRNVKTLTVSNVHASSSNVVTIQHTDGTNVVQIESVNLLAGERIAIREGVPTRVVDAAGMEKTNPIAQGQYTVQRLGTTVANATTTAAKITGLDLVCGPGTWVFEYFLRYQSSVVTTGVKLGVNHSGTVTSFMYNRLESVADTTATATQTAIADQDIVTTTGGLMEVWAQRAKSTTAPTITAGVDTINSDQLAVIQGIAVVTAGGNMELYHASETANSTSIMAESSLRLTKMG